MSQLHCYVPDDIAEKLKQRADAAQVPVSKYLAMLVKRDLGGPWPEGYFACFGAWHGDELARPEQGDYEERAAVD